MSENKSALPYHRTVVPGACFMNHPLTQVVLTYFIANSPLSFIISSVMSAAAYMSFTSSHSFTV